MSVKIEVPGIAIPFDHNKAANRDTANQHPISAITGLQGTLDSKGDKNWKASVNLSTDLPIVGNEPGDARVVTSEGAIYLWDDIAQQWKKGPSGGGGGGTTVDDLKILSAIYSSVNSRIEIDINKGLYEIDDSHIRKVTNYTFYITAPTTNTTYHVYVDKNGSTFYNTTGIIPMTVIYIGTITVAATLNDVTFTDERPILSRGGGGQSSLSATETTFQDPLDNSNFVDLINTQNVQVAGGNAKVVREIAFTDDFTDSSKVQALTSTKIELGKLKLLSTSNAGSMVSTIAANNVDTVVLDELTVQHASAEGFATSKDIIKAADLIYDKHGLVFIPASNRHILMAPSGNNIGYYTFDQNMNMLQDFTVVLNTSNVVRGLSAAYDPVANIIHTTYHISGTAWTWSSFDLNNAWAVVDNINIGAPLTINAQLFYNSHIFVNPNNRDIWIVAGTSAQTGDFNCMRVYNQARQKIYSNDINASAAASERTATFIGYGDNANNQKSIFICCYNNFAPNQIGQCTVYEYDAIGAFASQRATYSTAIVNPVNNTFTNVVAHEDARGFDFIVTPGFMWFLYPYNTSNIILCGFDLAAYKAGAASYKFNGMINNTSTSPNQSIVYPAQIVHIPSLNKLVACWFSNQTANNTMWYSIFDITGVSATVGLPVPTTGQLYTANTITLAMLATTDKTIILGNFRNAVPQYTFKVNGYGLQPTQVQCQVSNDNGMSWKNITLNQIVAFSGKGNVQVKLILTSPVIGTTPLVDSYKISAWDNTGVASGTLVSSKVTSSNPVVSATLSAGMTLNSGTVTWFISNDGGNNWIAVTLGSKTEFSNIQGSDLRIKAQIAIGAGQRLSPIIYDYTIVSSDSMSYNAYASRIHVLELSILKDRLRIDVLDGATKHQLATTVTDTFNDAAGINAVKSSNYTFDATEKSVKATDTLSPCIIFGTIDNASLVPTNAWLVAYEYLASGGTIDYYLSRDGGITFTQMNKDQLINISTQPAGSTIVAKAIINGNARLLAWGYGWY